MGDKVKATIKELEDMYDIEKDPEKESEKQEQDEWEITIKEGDEKLAKEFDVE